MGWVLMQLAEAQGRNSVTIHTAGGLLVLGKVLHPLCLRAANTNHLLRIAGNLLNQLAVVILTVLIAIARFGF